MMSRYECDQFAADALAVLDEILDETGIDIHLDFPRLEAMVDDIDRSHGGIITDHNELTEVVMGRYEYLNDVEYSAYKRALGKIYKRRMGARSSMNASNGTWAPFAPTERYDD
jgi:hypothetical protein